MANPEHLAILQEGVAAWNDWREDGGSLKVDLSGLILFGADLSRANLSQVDLSYSDLVGADLTGADLRNAELVGADLTGANLFRAELIGARLTGADLTKASLHGADLTQANLRKTNLAKAYLSWTTLVRTVLNEANVDYATVDFVAFGRTSMVGTTGLETVVQNGPSSLDPETVLLSGGLPSSFLRGCGWPERLIEYWPSIAGGGIELYSGFISYSHSEPDRSFARRLHDQLQGCGVRVWRDKHEVLPGDSIMVEIDRGIRLWDKTLLCCSETSLTSWWVEREIEKAIEKERRLYKERGERVFALIPLDLDGYLFDGWKHEYRSYLTERLAADFTGWESENAKFEEQFERVFQAMTVGGGKLPPPEPKL